MDENSAATSNDFYYPITMTDDFVIALVSQKADKYNVSVYISVNALQGYTIWERRKHGDRFLYNLPHYGFAGWQPTDWEACIEEVFLNHTLRKF